MSSKNKPISIDKEVLYDLYINQMMTSKEIGDMFDCTSKCIRNYLSKYGIPIRQSAEAIKLERSKWSEEKERERSLKYMQTWANKSQEEKDIAVQKRISNPNVNSPQSIQKARETKLRNGTYRMSKSEDGVYQQLVTILGAEDVLRGYIDSRYPFNCDFYIPSKDLFIEYQGHQTHGTEPYDPTNLEHLSQEELMTIHHIDTKTWTQRDPRKLELAKKNKIKLLLIYPRNDTYLVKDGEIENLHKFNLVNINDIN